jgi:hypothetical protein
MFNYLLSKYNYKAQSFQLKYPFKHKKVSGTGFNSPDKNSDKSYYPAEEELLTKTDENELGIESENAEKGNKFEKYVVDKFDDKLFSIVEWTMDMCRKHNRFVESDCNPDLGDQR